MSISSDEDDGGAMFNNSGEVTGGGSAEQRTYFINNYAKTDGGAIFHNGGNLTLSYITFRGNKSDYCGGAVFSNGWDIIELNNVIFEENSAVNGGAIFNTYGTVTVRNAVFNNNSSQTGSAGAIDNCYGTINLSGDIVLSTASDTILNFGGTLNLDISQGGCTISDYSRVTNYGNFDITVATDQKRGNYVLAHNVINFDECVSIKTDVGDKLGTISVGNTLHSGDTIYTLAIKGNNLLLTVDTAQDTLTQIFFAWQIKDTVFASTMDISAVASFQYKVDGAADWQTYDANTSVKVTSANSQVMFKTTDTKGNTSDITYTLNAELLPSTADTITIGSQQIHWDLSNDEQSEAKVTIQDNDKTMSFKMKAEEVSVLGAKTGMQISVQDSQGNSLGKLNLESTIPGGAETKPVEMDAGKADGVTDIFFARTNGVWEKGYIAEHTGYLKGGQLYAGTAERVELEGKNIVCDIFNGAADANVLFLTDDTNGDSLFVEDIYSESTGDLGKVQSRIAQIKEVYAGIGDDIVDMTSQQFEYTGEGITVHGGDGNDTIWATHGDNKLFGDTGNDRIVGADGNDVIAGGSGDDKMSGNGGSDIFCFCNGWGADTVEQLSDGTVTLWFESGSSDKWNKTTMTYTDGDNTVIVSGVTDVTLKFGDDQSELYKTLVSMDAFADKTSEKIFEEKDKSLVTSSK